MTISGRYIPLPRRSMPAAPITRQDPLADRVRSASAGMPPDRTSRPAAPANAPWLRHPENSAERCRPSFPLFHGHKQCIQPRDARDKELRARPTCRSCGRSLLELYNTVHPHSRLGYTAHPGSTSCPNPSRVRFNGVNSTRSISATSYKIRPMPVIIPTSGRLERAAQRLGSIEGANCDGNQHLRRAAP
jgi:hypothetical protein